MAILTPTLFFDLATNSGMVAADPKGIREIDNVCLMSDKERKAQKVRGLDRRNDIRFSRLCDWVMKKRMAHPDATRLVFEDVEFCSSRIQCQMWTTLRSALWCAARDFDFYCVNVKTLKLFFHGRGDASKEHMQQSVLKHPLFGDRFMLVKGILFDKVQGRPINDDEIDALALYAFTDAVDAGTQKWAYSIK